MPRRRVEPDPRALAFDILLRVETTDAFADVLLADRLAAGALGAQDSALVTRLVYGALAWQGRLDYELSGLVHKGRSLETPVRVALRLGLYQLRFLDRIPSYAAVDASVRLARRSGAGAAGLVNAVLRRAASAPRLPPRDPDEDTVTRLAHEWSHPRWLVERWANDVGWEELPALLAADNEAGATTVRAHPPGSRGQLMSDLRADDVQVAPGRWGCDAVVIERGAARLRTLPAWAAGRFAFQSEASQLIAPLLDVGAGARVLDACAAPGGKSAHLAALVAPGTVIALDPHAAGAARVVREAARLGISGVHAIATDARRLPLRGSFDAVLVDAPCSGLGTLRRHPELRWRRQPADIPRLAALQREVLIAVAPFVRPGGTLVYAACTIAPEETGEVIAALREAHPRFVLEPITIVPPELVAGDGTLRTFPHRHGLDGFYAARLRARQ